MEVCFLHLAVTCFPSSCSVSRFASLTCALLGGLLLVLTPWLIWCIPEELAHKYTPMDIECQYERVTACELLKNKVQFSQRTV